MQGVLLCAALKFSLQLETGPEYDSNAARAELLYGMARGEIGPPTGSPLWRSTLSSSLTWRRGRNLLRLAGTLGGKVFFLPDVQDQDTLVGQLTIDEKFQPRPRLWLGIALDYYDVGQLSVPSPSGTTARLRHRDFRSGSINLTLTADIQGTRLALDGGYRGVEYKPDLQYDFHGGMAHASIFRRFSVGDPERPHEIDLLTSHRIERRLFFAGHAQRLACPPTTPCVGDTNSTRDDWFVDTLFELTYVRALLLALSYGLTLDLSNSFGESFLRHTVGLKAGVRLPWELYASVKLQFLFTRFLDGLQFPPRFSEATFISLDEENRNSLVAELERSVWRHDLFVKVRYSLYTNELTSSPVDFMRHVIFVGLRYRWEIAR